MFKRFFFFLTWTSFKVFIEFTTTLFLVSILFFWPQGMWDPSSPTRDGTHTPCIGKQSLNHQTKKPFLRWIVPNWHFPSTSTRIKS